MSSIEKLRSLLLLWRGEQKCAEQRVNQFISSTFTWIEKRTTQSYLWEEKMRNTRERVRSINADYVLKNKKAANVEIMKRR